jgi:hypothetical protein
MPYQSCARSGSRRAARGLEAVPGRPPIARLFPRISPACGGGTSTTTTTHILPSHTHPAPSSPLRSAKMTLPPETRGRRVIFDQRGRGGCELSVCGGGGGGSGGGLVSECEWCGGEVVECVSDVSELEILRSRGGFFLAEGWRVLEVGLFPGGRFESFEGQGFARLVVTESGELR